LPDLILSPSGNPEGLFLFMVVRYACRLTW